MWQEFRFWSGFWFDGVDVSCFSDTSFEFGDEGRRNLPIFFAAATSVILLLQSSRIRLLISVEIAFMARLCAEKRQTSCQWHQYKQSNDFIVQ